LPALYPDRYYVTKGGLLSYGPSYPQMNKTAAAYVDKIFKGAKPGDLPVERPVLFDLTISDRAVKATGIAIPPSMLINAEVRTLRLLRCGRWNPANRTLSRR